MQIEGMHYCTPRILSIYYSLLLADRWGAQPLLNDLTFTYLKYAFGIRAQELQRAAKHLESFSEVFRGQLPEIDIRPHTGDRSCWSCAQADSCDKVEYKQIEKRLTEYLCLRDYDEVCQMKELHANLAATAKQDHARDIAAEIMHKFEDTRKVLHRRLHKIFPVAMRWSNLTTILSIPVVVAGVSTGAPIFAGVGAGIAGLSQIAKHYMDILASRNRWLCFRQDCAGSTEEDRRKSPTKSSTATE